MLSNNSFIVLERFYGTNEKQLLFHIERSFLQWKPVKEQTVDTWINTLIRLWFNYMEDHFRQNLEMKRDMCKDYFDLLFRRIGL